MSSCRLQRSTFLAVALAIALPIVAFAGVPCQDDATKFCANVPTGSGRVQECLKAHEKQLSPTCRKAVDSLRKNAQTFAAICVFDMQRFCSDTPPGGMRMLKCLETNHDDLSPNCKAQFDSAK
jgi:Golgi apparatus protein 1